MSSSSTPLSTPEGPGFVSGAPHLPEGFTDTFTSRYVDTGELRLHAVIGGDGAPVRLGLGWRAGWGGWRVVVWGLGAGVHGGGGGGRGRGVGGEGPGGEGD